MTTMPDPHEFIQARGCTMDRRLDAAFHVAEAMLGYELTVIKAHDPGASALSANTHKGTGVADLSAFDAPNKMRVLKRVGFAPYWRTPADGFVEHLHVVLRGEGHGLDPQAQRQVDDWMATPPRNGLANHGPDRNPWRPKPLPEPFHYAAWWADGQRRLKIKTLQGRIKRVNEHISALRTKRKMLKAQVATNRSKIHYPG